MTELDWQKELDTLRSSADNLYDLNRRACRLIERLGTSLDTANKWNASYLEYLGTLNTSGLLDGWKEEVQKLVDKK